MPSGSKAPEKLSKCCRANISVGAIMAPSLLYITSYVGASGFGNLSTDVYPFVAEKYNSKPLVVKWAIIRSIQYLYNKCDEETLDKIEAYFDIRYPEKMTPKLIITAITRMLETKK